MLREGERAPQRGGGRVWGSVRPSPNTAAAEFTIFVPTRALQTRYMSNRPFLPCSNAFHHRRCPHNKHYALHAIQDGTCLSWSRQHRRQTLPPRPAGSLMAVAVQALGESAGELGSNWKPEGGDHKRRAKQSSRRHLRPEDAQA